MTDVENGMIVEEVDSKEHIYGYCDHCEEPIRFGDECESLGEDEMGILCHERCFDDFVRENKIRFITERNE